MRLTFITLIASVTLFACVGAMLPHVSPMQAELGAKRWPDMDLTKYELARDLYVNRCSGCHNAVLPKEHSIEKWRIYLDKMAPRAKIDAQQKEMIWRYIVTAREPQQ